MEKTLAKKNIFFRGIILFYKKILVLVYCTLYSKSFFIILYCVLKILFLWVHCILYSEYSEFYIHNYTWKRYWRHGCRDFSIVNQNWPPQNECPFQNNLRCLRLYSLWPNSFKIQTVYVLCKYFRNFDICYYFYFSKQKASW